MNPDRQTLHICLVSQEFPPETGWGGIGTYTHEMAHALTRMGHRVTVIARAVEREAVQDDQGVTVHRILPQWSLDRVPFFWRLNRLWEGYRLAVATKLHELHRQSPFDVIEAPEIRAETALFYLGALRPLPPLMVKLHTPFRLVDILSGRSPGLKQRLNYRLESYLVRRADRVVSCSGALVERCRDILPLRGKEVRVIHNPIRVPESANEPNDAPSVLYSGRLEWRKGVQVFGAVIPAVLSERPETRFSLLGADSPWSGGPSLKEHILSRIPASMAQTVSFTGAVSREEVTRHLQDVPICVFPSLWENFPYTCLEAMAHGCAVIGSENGGMSEMIEQGVSGFLVDPEKPEEISCAILQLLENPELRRAMGGNAARRVREQFSSARIAEQTVEVYREAIGAHARKSHRSKVRP